MMIACLDDVTALYAVTQALATPATAVPGGTYFQAVDAMMCALASPVLTAAAPAAIAAAAARVVPVTLLVPRATTSSAAQTTSSSAAQTTSSAAQTTGAGGGGPPEEETPPEAAAPAALTGQRAPFKLMTNQPMPRTDPLRYRNLADEMDRSARKPTPRTLLG